MSLNVTLTGQLIAGPPVASDTGFPSGVTNLPFNLNPPQKPIGVDTGVMVRNVASPGSFVTLDGVPNTVAQGTTFYFRCSQPFTVRTTRNDPGNPDIVQTQDVNGLFILEPPVDKYLKLVEVKGAGLIEYYLSGQS